MTLSVLVSQIDQLPSFLQSGTKIFKKMFDKIKMQTTIVFNNGRLKNQEVEFKEWIHERNSETTD